MQRSRRGPPKHLERTLFINHKEDQMLDTRLNNLNLESRLRLMELDREKGKVRVELRNSRKKQITINEAISTGLVPAGDANFLYGGKRPPTNISSAHGLTNESNYRRSSAPAQRDPPVAEFTRSSTNLRPIRNSNGQNSSSNQKNSNNNQLSLPPTILEDEELGRPTSVKNDSRRHLPKRQDSLGNYVLGEFEKIAQVVPDILRTLAKKKERQQEVDELSRLRDLKHDVIVDMDRIIDYEPDMNKVRKTVFAVKKLRHRMALSKRLETPSYHRSFEQMIKDRTDSIGDNDEYTDGTCALMKRRLEKKRRESAPFALEPSFMQRRGSYGETGCDWGKKLSEVNTVRRSSSVSHLPGAVSRSSTMLSFGSGGRLNSLGTDSDGDDSPFIDEDVLVNRQRVMREINKYRSLQTRVERFITSTAAQEILPLN